MRTSRKIGRMDWQLAVYVAAVFAIAGMVKGIAGMGLPTVGVSLLGLAMAPSSAAALLVLPSLATNLAQCAGRHTLSLVRRFGWLWLAIGLGCVFTPVPTIGTGVGIARICLAVALIVHGAWTLVKPTLPHPRAAEWWISPLVGYATGVITVCTGVFVIPVSAYLQSLRLEKEDLVQALGVTFTVCTLGLALRLGLDHVPLMQSGPAALLALLCAFAGMAAGVCMRKRLDQKAFSRVMSCVLIVLGCLMIAREM
jgi:hypothetical protein